MKDTVKRTLLVFCAASVMMLSTSVFASSGTTTKSAKTVSASSVTTSASGTSGTSGTSSASDATDSTTDSTTDEDTTSASGGVVQDQTRPVPTAISTGQNQTGVIQTTEAQRAAEKKYASKGSIAFWFIFSILINIVISFNFFIYFPRL